jgi:glutamine amidotransferase
MPDKIVIVNYGMGNLRSVVKKFEHLNIEAKISSEKHTIEQADKIILPGVGHFANAMRNLANLGLIDVLNNQVLMNKKPVLGICLGLQLFAKFSEEGNCEGLGWIDAEVIRFHVSDPYKFKIPHIGWNSIELIKESEIFKGLRKTDQFYFVHSFHLVCHNQKDILTTTEYDYSFTSAIEKGNIYGCQFHPEKSHDAGDLILRNFASTNV